MQSTRDMLLMLGKCSLSEVVPAPFKKPSTWEEKFKLVNEAIFKFTSEKFGFKSVLSMTPYILNSGITPLYFDENDCHQLTEKNFPEKHCIPIPALANKESHRAVFRIQLLEKGNKLWYIPWKDIISSGIALTDQQYLPTLLGSHDEMYNTLAFVTVLMRGPYGLYFEHRFTEGKEDGQHLSLVRSKITDWPDWAATLDKSHYRKMTELMTSIALAGEVYVYKGKPLMVVDKSGHAHTYVHSKNIDSAEMANYLFKNTMFQNVFYKFSNDKDFTLEKTRRGINYIQAFSKLNKAKEKLQYIKNKLERLDFAEQAKLHKINIKLVSNKAEVSYYEKVVYDEAESWLKAVEQLLPDLKNYIIHDALVELYAEAKKYIAENTLRLTGVSSQINFSGGMECGDLPMPTLSFRHGVS